MPEGGTGRDVESERPVVVGAPRAVTPKLGECLQQIPETRSDRSIRPEELTARYSEDTAQNPETPTERRAYICCV